MTAGYSKTVEAFLKVLCMYLTVYVNNIVYIHISIQLTIKQHPYEQRKYPVAVFLLMLLPKCNVTLCAIRCTRD